MVFEEVIIGGETLVFIISKLGIWIQALGVAVILWIIFQSVILWLNAKRMKELYKIKEDMKRIEGKINKLLKS